ncbi:MAG: hypothetical protein ABSH56_14695 [Bryobacteraceae bacterium]|jgi:hypothetical protein
MDWKDAFTAAGIAVTLLLGVWNAVGNYRTSRRTNFINTVTSQRVKWIEQLRQDISAFSGLVHTWYFSAQGKPQEYEVVKEIDRLRHVIRLRLNPAGEHDGRIEALLEEIPKLTAAVDADKLTAALNELTVESQRLLKEEWEKVKDEAERGKLKRAG